MQAAYPAAYPPGGGYPPATAAHDQGQQAQLQQLPPSGEAQQAQQQPVEDDADCICCGVSCTIL